MVNKHLLPFEPLKIGAIGKFLNSKRRPRREIWDSLSLAIALPIDYLISNNIQYTRATRNAFAKICAIEKSNCTRPLLLSWRPAQIAWGVEKICFQLELCAWDICINNCQDDCVSFLLFFWLPNILRAFLASDFQAKKSKKWMNECYVARGNLTDIKFLPWSSRNFAQDDGQHRAVLAQLSFTLSAGAGAMALAAAALFGHCWIAQT